MARLGQSGGDNSDRAAEMTRILTQQGLSDHLERMTPTERDFVERMVASTENGDEPTVTSNQLFWLRDLCERYCR